jgi:pimeloyl-ACP methyl ester carboxylesterase
VDYTKPDGRHIGIAVSRIKATGSHEGAVLINPGGPGIGGMKMPKDLSASKAAGIGVHHDLIGFDPRGIDYSGDLRCTPDGTQPPASLSDKEKARFLFDRIAATNRNCVTTDPEFVRNVTTANIARDMDHIRIALGQPKIGYYGISWGTALGAEYRTLFDGSVDKMLLDSVMPPTLSLAAMDDGQANAAENTFHEFSAWLARYDAVYHFGTQTAQVAQALLDLRRQFADHPRTVGGTTVDGKAVNDMLADPRRDWANLGKSLATIRDGGMPAQFRRGSVTNTGWDTTPNGGNEFQQTTLLCNESTGARDFDTMWHDRQTRQAKYPVAGGYGVYDGKCAGWPLPAQAWHFTTGTSPLQLVGHAYEPVTPIGWAISMQHRIGGSLLTVEDDAHGSLKDLPCATKAVEFFDTGKTSTDSCPGDPIPAPAA